MEPLVTEEYPPLKEYIFYVIPANVKGEKVSILRFRRRKHSMRKIGHRQRYTQIKIKEINVGK